MPHTVLDHGYVSLIETWGSDERIVEAARMSTNKGFQGWGPKDCTACGAGTSVPRGGVGTGFPVKCPVCVDGKVPGDEKLLAYLYSHEHMTPFEMAGMVIEVQAPIFVFREWHRHRTQSYNELSARYTELPDIYYVPSVERLMASKQSSKNKQSSDVGFSFDAAIEIRADIINAQAKARASYELLLKQGVSREIARVVVPVSQYSRMRASANLRNWLAFLTLRMNAAAQFEIRQYAQVVGGLIESAFPRTWALFVNGQ